MTKNISNFIADVFENAIHKINRVFLRNDLRKKAMILVWWLFYRGLCIFKNTKTGSMKTVGNLLPTVFIMFEETFFKVLV